MDLLETFKHLFAPKQRVTPAMFRRGKLPTGVLIYKPDKNSRHIGAFGDKITPMKRRFRGVSRTAK